MKITRLSNANILAQFRNQPSKSLDFIILVSGSLTSGNWKDISNLLLDIERTLKLGGILFVQGIPEQLPQLGVLLEKAFTFKYWVAVESMPKYSKTGLPSVHAGILLFTKGSKERFHIKRTRLPHQYCAACGKSLKDWGGKSHLMHPQGYVISDVIKDLPLEDNYSQLSQPVLEHLLSMLDFRGKKEGKLVALPDQTVAGIIAPIEAGKNRIAESQFQYHRQLSLLDAKPSNNIAQKTKLNEDQLFNVVHQGDAIEILRQYPVNSIDLLFADPPYNLAKNYATYADGKPEQQYINWCNAWLYEYARLLKPSGSMFVLNLPRWAMHHANFLNQRLYFQNWIVWDALSEPRGKLMPAHYSLLHYTKHPTEFTFNYDAVSPITSRKYCLRTPCKKRRLKLGDNEKTSLNDIWWDIHRIRHKRDRDHHPCQLPESLMERIISLTTNPNDIVLDAFGGVGTTPVTAFRLKRRYVAVDIDPYYVQVMQEKLAEIEAFGKIQRNSISKDNQVVSKKSLQLALRQLAIELGRLPSPEDVAQNCPYDLDLFLSSFPTWSKALKAAKIEFEE